VGPETAGAVSRLLGQSAVRVCNLFWQGLKLPGCAAGGEGAGRWPSDCRPPVVHERPSPTGCSLAVGAASFESPRRVALQRRSSESLAARQSHESKAGGRTSAKQSELHAGGWNGKGAAQSRGRPGGVEGRERSSAQEVQLGPAEPARPAAKAQIYDTAQSRFSKALTLHLPTELSRCQSLSWA
jgi:hypothetical protein